MFTFVLCHPFTMLATQSIFRSLFTDSPPSLFTVTQTAWFCASWLQTRRTKVTSLCRFTSHYCRHSAVTTTSTSCECPAPGDWLRFCGRTEKTATATSLETCTASWSRYELPTIPLSRTFEGHHGISPSDTRTN